LITCAGLYSDRVAALSGAAPEPKVIPMRGEWRVITPEKRDLVKSLIYPVP
jgi:L-2-hydroxyglutarate oxidase LhgO